jgi:hypothetical protein
MTEVTIDGSSDIAALAAHLTASFPIPVSNSATAGVTHGYFDKLIGTVKHRR